MAGERTNAQARAKVTDLIRDTQICMLITVAEDGRPVSRPMGLQEAEFDGVLWFFAYADSEVVRQIQRHPAVDVAFASQKNNTWVSVSGTAEQTYDRSTAEQMWNPFLRTWFPEGLDTPGLTMLRVRATTAEYWDPPSGGNVLGMARSAMTGRPPEPGENRRVSYP